MRSEIHISTIDLGEVLDGGSEHRVLWVLGKGAVGRSREPGKTMFDGGIWTAAVAMFPFFPLSSFFYFSFFFLLAILWFRPLLSSVVSVFLFLLFFFFFFFFYFLYAVVSPFCLMGFFFFFFFGFDTGRDNG